MTAPHTAYVRQCRALSNWFVPEAMSCGKFVLQALQCTSSISWHCSVPRQLRAGLHCVAQSSQKLYFVHDNRVLVKEIQPTMAKVIIYNNCNCISQRHGSARSPLPANNRADPLFASWSNGSHLSQWYGIHQE